MYRPFARMWPSVVVFASAAAAFGQDALKYVPDKSEVLVGINIRQIAGSNLVRRYGDQLLRKPAVEAFKEGNAELSRLLSDEKTSAALKEFLGKADTLTFGHVPETGGGVVALTGRFDAAAVRDLIDRIKPADVPLKSEKVGNADVYKLGEGENAGFAAAADGVLLYADSRESLAAALDKAAGNRKTKPTAAVAELIGKVDTSGSAWVVVADDDTRVYAALHIGDDVAARVTVPAGSAEQAKARRDEVEKEMEGLKSQAAGLLRRSKALGPLVDLINTVKVGVEGGNVVISARLTAQDLERRFRDE
jgi:hypothetical protein